MKTFRFAYTEIGVGFIDVIAENEDDARAMAESLDGDTNTFIRDINTEVGKLIETIE